MRPHNLILLIVAVMALSGCASMEGKFKATAQANVGAFADQTIAMLSSSDLGVAQDNAIYVRHFIKPGWEEVKRYEMLTSDAELMLRGIVKYSIRLVTIAETNKTEETRIEAYTKYLEEVQHNAEGKLQLAPGYYDEIIVKVGTEEKFLPALQQAQPIINAVGRYAQLLMDDINDATKKLARKIDAHIDSEYAEVITYQKALEKEKYAVLRALGKLYRAYEGENSAFEEVLQSKVIRDRKLIPKGQPSEEDLRNIADHLVKRLDVISKIWQEIEPDWNNYRETHRELDRLHAKVDQDANRMRAMVIVWLRAHQKMAAGVQNPAEWFDVESAPSQLFQLGVKAIF
ncbi:hypothetical protein [Kaarinaea lacus]